MSETPPLALPKSLSDTYAVERELERRDGIASFLAREARGARVVTINLVRPEVIKPALIAAELGILKSLQHANILRVIELGHGATRDGTANVVYSVTPFVEGRTLRQRLESERHLPLDAALRIATEIGAALTYAHRHGIVHQGVSPDCVVLTERETLLTDFGLSKWLLQPGARGDAVPPISWLPYASPEQALADVRIDAHTDQYSLASVLYEMLSGTPPFTGSTSQIILGKVVSEAPPRLTTIRRVPRLVERAIERALSKSPRDRYPSVDAFISALRGAAARTPLVASKPVPTTPWRHRSWRAPLAAASVVVATGAGIAVASRAVANRSPTAETESAGAIARTQLTFTGRATAPALSPDGQSVAYIAGGRSLAVQAVDGGEPVELIPSARAISVARWTGNGKTIVVAMARDGDERLATYLVPARGGAARKVFDDARPFDAGADATVIVRAAPERGLLEIVNVTSGRATRRIVLPDSIGPIAEVSWSPDRRWIAFTDASSRDLWTVAAVGGRPSRIADDARSIRWAGGSDGLYFLSGRYGAMDLMRVAVDRVSGRATGEQAHITSLFSADAFDVDGDGRVVHTQTAPSAPALTFVLGGQVPRHAVEQHPLREQTGRVDAPAISPNGRWVAYGAAQGADRDIHIVPFGGGPPRIFATERGREHAPSWSPDGGRLAFTRNDSASRHVMIASAQTGSAERIASTPGLGASEMLTTVRWSASGRQIAYYANDLRRIAVVNLQRRIQSTVPVPEYTGRGHFAVLPSPNATILLATTADNEDGSPRLWLVSANGRRWRQVRGLAGETLPVAWHRSGWIYLVRNRGVVTERGAAQIELWRMHGTTGQPQLYATLPEGCGMSVSISADASRGVCNFGRVESDLYVASGLDGPVR